MGKGYSFLGCILLRSLNIDSFNRRLLLAQESHVSASQPALALEAISPGKLPPPLFLYVSDGVLTTRLIYQSINYSAETPHCSVLL